MMLALSVFFSSYAGAPWRRRRATPAKPSQLASERQMMPRYSRCQPILRFGRIAGDAAGALDLVVYNFAARKTLNINLDQHEAGLRVASSGPVATKFVGRRHGSRLRS
jgi:hypothetical protein